MGCPAEKAKDVTAAILKVHPYEEVKVDFVKLEDIYRIIESYQPNHSSC